MMEYVDQTIHAAETLLAGGNYEEAVVALEAISSACDRRQSARRHLLLGEALIRLGRYDHDYVSDALEYYRETAENAKYAMAKFLRGWQLQALGENQLAKETWLEAYAAFLRIRDHHHAAATQNRLAQLCYIQGNTEQAVENLEQSVLRFESIGETTNAICVRANLALALSRCGRFSRSLEVYAEIEKSINHVTYAQRLSILLGLSAVTALTGDVEIAASNIASLEKESDGYGREHTIAYEYSGWIHLLAGKYKQAETALSKGLTLALEMSPENDLVSQIKRLLADVYVATGKWAKAEQFAREALAVAEKLTERLEIAACHRVFAQVEQHRGNAETARDWYRQAIDLFAQIGAHYELAMTRMLAGSSDLYATAERIAMLYLAREYFESESLKHLLVQVDQHLAKSAPAVVTNRHAENAPTVVAVNPAMRRLLELARNIAPSRMTVLLTGDTGTGKDLLAKYIHEHSGCKGEFVSQNVAALPSSMVEAELFGHRKGAFTGADHDRAGLIKQAEGGTFFLNEIGEASLDLQAKLLEVLETRCIRPVGDDKSQPVDFRLIAATNANLLACVQSGKFRTDLYHRLSQLTLHLSPLSQRPEDIAPLVGFFLKELGCEVESQNGNLTELVRILARGSWPGNVRELKAAVGRMWLASGGILSRMIALVVEECHDEDDNRFASVLAECEGNQRKAARTLGIDESTLRYHLKKRLD